MSFGDLVGSFLGCCPPDPSSQLCPGTDEQLKKWIIIGVDFRDYPVDLVDVTDATGAYFLLFSGRIQPSDVVYSVADLANELTPSQIIKICDALDIAMCDLSTIIINSLGETLEDLQTEIC